MRKMQERYESEFYRLVRQGVNASHYEVYDIYYSNSLTRYLLLIAYYCGMKCFNADLPKHQEFCITKAFYTEPKKSEFSIPSPKLDNIVRSVAELKEFMADPPIEGKSPKKEKSTKKKSDETPKTPKPEKVKKEKKLKISPKKASKKKSEETPTKDESDLGQNESEDDEFKNKSEEIPANDESELGQKESEDDECKNESKEIPANDESDMEQKESDDEWEEETIVSKKVDITTVISPGNNNSGDNLNISPLQTLTPTSSLEKTYKIKAGTGTLPDSVPFERETVDLRKAPMRASSAFFSSELPHVDLHATEIQTHEYEWEQPDWINSTLRSTEIGEKIKLSGDLRDPNLKSSTADEQKKYQSIPEWARKDILKKTQMGVMLKQGVDVHTLNTPVAISRRRSLEFGGTAGPLINLDNDVILKEAGIDVESKLEAIKWKQPEWAKDAMLRKTGMLDQLKGGVSLNSGTQSYSNLDFSSFNASVGNIGHQSYNSHTRRLDVADLEISPRPKTDN